MRGLFIGRFQPLHKGHVSIIEAALGEMDELVVVIGSAESSYTEKDPFTAGERVLMLREAGKELGWGERVILIPVRDVNRYSIWVDHVISYVPPIDAVYSNNGLTRTLFMEKGYEVRTTPLVERDEFSGLRIRERLANDSGWEELVPTSVVKVLKGMNAVNRMKGVLERGDVP